MFLYALISCGASVTKKELTNRELKPELGTLAQESVVMYSDDNVRQQPENVSPDIIINIENTKISKEVEQPLSREIIENTYDISALKQILSKIVDENRVKEFLKKNLSLKVSDNGIENTLSLIESLILSDHSTFEEILRIAKDLNVFKQQFNKDSLKKIVAFLKEDKKIELEFLKNIKLAVESYDEADRLALGINELFLKMIELEEIEIVTMLLSPGYFKSLNPDLKNDKYNSSSDHNPLEVLAAKASNLKYSLTSDDNRKRLNNLKRIIISLLDNGMSPSYIVEKNGYKRNFIQQFDEDEYFLIEIKSKISNEELLKLRKILKDLRIETSKINRVFYR